MHLTFTRISIINFFLSIFATLNKMCYIIRMFDESFLSILSWLFFFPMDRISFMIFFSHIYYNLLDCDDKNSLKNSHGSTFQLEFSVRIVMEFESIRGTLRFKIHSGCDVHVHRSPFTLLFSQIYNMYCIIISQEEY